MVHSIVGRLRALNPKSDGPVHRSGLEAGSVGTGVSGKRGYWTEKIVIIQRKLEGVMPADKKAKFLSSENYEFEKVIDFYICSQSDVFVSSVSGLFYANAVGKRIASGKSQILVLAQVTVSSALNFSFILLTYLEKTILLIPVFVEFT
ncbi:Protein MANNAN synthesis-related 2 [Vitis vinifera]|uniref:Protein MANNAN synthesis-related 2 n=1 Tax=Vitis vinifera TaxID=29760 RepID=A0A438GUM1_VITVI|nr:Protein MANNAN synthesis-related 2 [Vitis vinifera]